MSRPSSRTDSTWIDILRRGLTDDSWWGFWRRRQAVRRLIRLATGPVLHDTSRNSAAARAVVEGLAEGLEGVHWSVQVHCRRVLEGLKEPQLIEAVCDVLLEQDLPRLRALAAHRRYEPHEPKRRAAFLFALGRAQFYDAYDPTGELLEQFYVGALPGVRTHLLGLARSRGDACWSRLVLSALRHQGWAALPPEEAEAVVEALSRGRETDDPTGELLIQLYTEASQVIRERLMQTAQDWSTSRRAQLMAGLLRCRSGSVMSSAELTFALQVLPAEQCWEDLWTLALVCPLPASWQGLRALVRAGWQPRAEQAVSCWQELATAVQVVEDPFTVMHSHSQRTGLRGHQGGVRALAVSPDGVMLASGGGDGAIYLWELPGGRQRAVLRGHQGGVWALACSPDGATLASGGGDGAICLWELPSGRQWAVLRGHQGGVWTLAFSPDGATLASGGGDGVINLWTLSERQRQQVLWGHWGGIWALAFNAAGTTLASGSEDKTVRLWDLVNGRQFPVHQGHQQEVWALALSPDGSAVISGGGDGAILLWDPHTGEQRAVLARQRGSVESLVCSSDGMTLASGGEDGIIFWDLASGQQRTVIQGHHDKVWALAFNPTGTTLISGGDDGVVMLWEVWNLPRLLHVPLGHMNQTDYHHMQSLAADTTLSPTHQAVARYITAALGYRLSMGKRDACAV